MCGAMQDVLDHERRFDDEHTRNIVHLTVREIFDGVGVDFSTPVGRQRFRENISFLDDARVGTGAAKKTAMGLALTGFAYGAWKAFVALVPVMMK